MTARADVSNHRRKVLEERAAQRAEAIRSATKTVRSGSGWTARAGEATAWDKGEALPPFYREVLEEGVRRGDVVSKEEHTKLIERYGWTYEQLLDARRELNRRVRAGEQQANLETPLREANAAAEFAQEQAEIAWAKLREAEIADREWVQHTQELGNELREAEGRIERARNALEALSPNPAGSDPVSVALSILAGTEKEGDRE